MPEDLPPLVLQSGEHPADLTRHALFDLLVDGEGVIEPGALLVTEDDTPGMRVKVAGGRIAIAGTRQPDQGMYVVYADDDKVVNLAASDPTNARIDLIVARIRDNFYDVGLDGDWIRTVVTGTPSGSPVEPAVPDDTVVLARVDVGAGVSSITDGNITDRRPSAFTLRDVRDYVQGHAALERIASGSATATASVDISVPSLDDYELIRITLIGQTVGSGLVGALVDGATGFDHQCAYVTRNLSDDNAVVAVASGTESEDVWAIGRWTDNALNKIEFSLWRGESIPTPTDRLYYESVSQRLGGGSFMQRMEAAGRLAEDDVTDLSFLRVLALGNDLTTADSFSSVSWIVKGERR